MLFLKEDTSATIRLGPFVDSVDGKTYEVGMAAAMDNATTGIRVSKNGAAFADRNDATAPVYDAFGYYSVVLDGTDTSTPGTLQVIFGDAAVCLPCEANFMIVAANIYDSLFGAGTTFLKTDMTQILAHTLTNTGTQIADAFQTMYDVASPVLTCQSVNQAQDNATVAEINAEVVDALGTDTIAELAQGIPSATPTIKQALMLLYMALRNESLTTASLLSIKNDAGTVITKATLADDSTTMTKGKLASGA